VAYVRATVNHYFPAARLTSADVVSAFAGLRPLVAPPPGTEEAPSEVSREEEIFVSPAGLISVAGGKLTTYRLIAAEVVDRVAERLVRTVDGELIGRSRTADRPLPGGSAPPETLAAAAASRHGHGIAPGLVDH